MKFDINLHTETLRDKRNRYAREWYHRNIEKGRAASREWRNRHLEERREAVRAYRAIHVDDINAARRKERSENGPTVTTPEQRARYKAWREKNRDAIRAKDRLQRESNASVRRDRHLRYKYGASLAEVEARITEQQGMCAACGGPLSDECRKKGRAPALDHCHATGKRRGVVHDRCNLAMGLLQDDPILIRRIADYLEAHRGQ